MRFPGKSLLALVLGSGPAALLAQAPPFGAEFQVNGSAIGASAEFFPAAASSGDGSFVVVWHSSTGDGYLFGIVGQRFDGAGQKVGPEFQVNSYTPSQQTNPAVAARSDGSFVVVWESNGQDGSEYGVFGQRFDSSGAKVGSGFRVNTFTTGWQRRPAVASDSAGNFVVVWNSAGQDGSGNGVFGQRFSSSGSKVGAEFQVNTYTRMLQQGAGIASDDAGNFVVVWSSLGQDGSGFGIFGQRFNTAGTKIGPEFRVNSYTTSHQLAPAVAGGRAGSFVVVWNSFEQDGSSDGIFGQRFDGSGSKVGPEFQVNTYTTADQSFDAVSADDTGNFTVVWTSLGQDGSSMGIFGQRFDRRGERVGSEFPINTITAGLQFRPRITHNGLGYVVVWETPDDGGEDIAGRRQNFSPATLAVDAHPGADTLSDSNGVLEPGERAVVEPAWVNHNPFFVGLQGTLSSLTGPAGGIYLVNDASSFYLDVAPGSVTDCDDGVPDACYTVSAAGTRPAQHWDATAQEDLSNVGSQFWKLHIGDSFSDVPRTNPFYGKIEAILHQGITTGCGGTQYCPSSPVTRSEMATFIARGIAGIGENVPSSGVLLASPYNCSSGGNSLFTDVAPTAPFCKHVHYVAAQNVTLGCGVAAYCPSQNVTRDVMASFIARAVVAPSGGNAVPATYTDPGTTLSYSCEVSTPDIHFTDVPVSHPFCKHIHYLWAKGVVSGCSSTQYCPGGFVNRAGMAKFIANGFNLQLYRP